MKTIAIVANHIDYAKYLRDNLSPFLKNYARIICYSTKDIERLEYLPEDIIVVSAFTIFQNVKHKITGSSDMVMASLTINKNKLKPLTLLPPGTKALLCNIDYRTSMQVIAELHTAGYRNLELVPYFGEGDYDRTIDLAITPDEHQTVPPGIGQVIDIGQRLVDLSCIYDIAVRLGVGSEFAATELVGTRQYACYSYSSIEKILGEHNSMAEQINVLLTLIPQGIIVTNLTGKICLSNEKAGRLLEKRSEILDGFALGDILPELKDYEAQTGKGEVKNKIVKVDGTNLIVSVRQIDIEGDVIGTVVTIDNFEEREDIQHDIRSRLNQVSHSAYYSFSDIKGSSRVISETVLTAKRLAKSEASILITGESGTGKEVFAQSVHNSSHRKDYNFVAVNCAAIPENLLESEMFGYEEGSFTGARKGGQAGYFELSHKGTIFLDEIAELPLPLQSKLLRVIEEKKIIKIGSQKVVNIDVRIIAATNQDLFDLVEKGRLREDLYYRLNVLPLRLPPLRDRSEDVPLLMEHFKGLQKLRFKLTSAALESLRRDPWRGNIRELRNTIEYLGSLGKPLIGQEDLPAKAIRRPKENRGGSGARLDDMAPKGGETAGVIKNFILKEGQRLDLYMFILEKLNEALAKNLRLGRRPLLEASQSGGWGFTEAEIRGGLKRLDEYGFVRLGQGRGGSRITSVGQKLLDKINLGLMG